mgnify:CR=1 FL=1
MFYRGAGMDRAGLLGGGDGILVIFLILQLVGDGLDHPCGLAATSTGGGRDEARFQVRWQGEGNHGDILSRTTNRATLVKVPGWTGQDSRRIS